MSDFAHDLPKAELHLHIEGTLEPELMFELAQRNGVAVPYTSVEEVRAAYVFTDLQSFLDIYYAACDVLRTEADFHDLARAYLERAAAQGVRHAEIFFDPQTHTARGVPFADVVGGIHRALASSDISSRLILCFLRHLSPEDAMATLEEALPHLDLIDGIGLDSSEVGNPPGRFADVFRRARELGLFAVAHAGEEGPPSYITEALDQLAVRRIDHGVRCIEDDGLVERLARDRVPLTVCPLSNVRLAVFPSMADHTIGELLDRGLCVTVNSDDPAYFGGYVGDNYRAIADELGLDRDQLVTLARNSFEAAVLEPAERAQHLEALEAFLRAG
ncbi:MAG: adenosine deaminase [Acidimicrobiales bacterium]|nr:adenosine deaminase [Acidimicrobiales bacterium]